MIIIGNMKMATLVAPDYASTLRSACIVASDSTAAAKD